MFKGILGGVAAVAAAVVIISFMSLFTVKSGWVAVPVSFGKVQDKIYTEGIGFAAPWVDVKHFDCRQKTEKVQLSVPSQDQLLTKFDISIQFRTIANSAPNMLKETGNVQAVIDTHMVPLFMSKVREIGKSVESAEMFFDQKVQERFQNELFLAMAPLVDKGIKVEKLLIRNVQLPALITNAVARKKEAAQAAEKAKEELKKFKIDQERKEAQAEAEKRAELVAANKKKEVMLIAANAELEAERIRAQAVLVKADAEAKAKRKQIDVVGRDGYVKLQAIEAYEKAMTNGSTTIISDGTLDGVVPLMNLMKK